MFSLLDKKLMEIFTPNCFLSGPRLKRILHIPYIESEYLDLYFLHYYFMGCVKSNVGMANGVNPDH